MTGSYQTYASPRDVYYTSTTPRPTTGAGGTDEHGEGAGVIGTDDYAKNAVIHRSLGIDLSASSINNSSGSTNDSTRLNRAVSQVPSTGMLRAKSDSVSSSATAPVDYHPYHPSLPRYLSFTHSSVLGEGEAATDETPYTLNTPYTTTNTVHTITTPRTAAALTATKPPSTALYTYTSLADEEGAQGLTGAISTSTRKISSDSGVETNIAPTTFLDACPPIVQVVIDILLAVVGSGMCILGTSLCIAQLVHQIISGHTC